MIDIRIYELDTIIKKDETRTDNFKQNTLTFSQDTNYQNEIKQSAQGTLKVVDQLNSIRSGILDLKSKIKNKNKLIEKLKYKDKDKSPKRSEHQFLKVSKNNSEIFNYKATSGITEFSFMNNLKEDLDETQISLYVPRWIPDQVIHHCSNCRSKFGIFKRKHHCRKCGEIFCKSCCNFYDTFLPFYSNKVRLCRTCIKHT